MRYIAVIYIDEGLFALTLSCITVFHCVHAFSIIYRSVEYLLAWK